MGIGSQGGFGNDDLFGVPTDAELQAEKDKMKQQKSSEKPNTSVDQTKKETRNRLPEIGGKGWNQVGGFW